MDPSGAQNTADGTSTRSLTSTSPPSSASNPNPNSTQINNNDVVNGVLPGGTALQAQAPSQNPTVPPTPTQGQGHHVPNRNTLAPLNLNPPAAVGLGTSGSNITAPTTPANQHPDVMLSENPQLLKKLIVRELQKIPRSTPSSSSSIPPPPQCINKAEVNCPTPLGWTNDHRSAPFSKHVRLDIPKKRAEYSVISALVSCAEITKVERIVNVTLWRKFVNARQEILCSKSGDLELLRELMDSNEDEFLQKMEHAIFKFDKDPLVAQSTYGDNIALLFHGTNGNIEDILNQGLDERLGRYLHGLFGRGIYFADDPLKSITYDNQGALIIFAVLLGDCMAIDHLPEKKIIVREPEKVKHQKRTPTDHFFDSVVGRPANTNEYVIYNRYQCYPLYLISYNRDTVVTETNSHPKDLYSQRRDDLLSQKRSKLPPFTWLLEGEGANSETNSDSAYWPFFAKTIFEATRIKEQIFSIINFILDLKIPGFTMHPLPTNIFLLHRKCNYDMTETMIHILGQPNSGQTSLFSSPPPSPSKIDSEDKTTAV